MKIKENLKLKQELKELDSYDQHRKSLEDTSRRYIGQVNSKDFVSRARTFLAYTELKVLPNDEHRTLDEPIYMQPVFDCEKFRGYIRQYMLDHIELARSKPMSSEKKYPVYVSTGSSWTPNTESIFSEGDESVATAWSDSLANSESNFSTLYSPPIYQDEFPIDTAPAKFAELSCFTNLKRFEGSHLKLFSSAVFNGDTVWISGHNKIFS